MFCFALFCFYLWHYYVLQFEAVGQWISLIHIKGWEHQIPVLCVIVALRGTDCKWSFNKGKLGKVKEK